MVFAPMARTLPFTVRVAVAVEADAPPVGGFVPVTAVTVAVTCVDADAAIPDGVAVIFMVTPTPGGALVHPVARL